LLFFGSFSFHIFGFQIQFFTSIFGVVWAWFSPSKIRCKTDVVGVSALSPC